MYGHQLLFTFGASISSSNKNRLIAPWWGLLWRQNRMIHVQLIFLYPWVECLFWPVCQIWSRTWLLTLTRKNPLQNIIEQRVFYKYLGEKLKVGVHLAHDTAFHSQTRNQVSLAEWPESVHCNTIATYPLFLLVAEGLQLLAKNIVAQLEITHFSLSCIQVWPSNQVRPTGYEQQWCEKNQSSSPS